MYWCKCGWNSYFSSPLRTEYCHVKHMSAELNAWFKFTLVLGYAGFIGWLSDMNDIKECSYCTPLWLIAIFIQKRSNCMRCSNGKLKLQWKRLFSFPFVSTLMMIYFQSDTKILIPFLTLVLVYIYIYIAFSLIRSIFWLFLHLQATIPPAAAFQMI